MIGTLAILHWMTLTRWSSVGRVALSNPMLIATLNRSLVHLKAKTAPRHIFTQTLDSVFLGLGVSYSSKGPAGQLMIPQSSIVVHLGDDLWGCLRNMQYSPISRQVKYHVKSQRLYL